MGASSFLFAPRPSDLVASVFPPIDPNRFAVSRGGTRSTWSRAWGGEGAVDRDDTRVRFAFDRTAGRGLKGAAFLCPRSIGPAHSPSKGGGDDTHERFTFGHGG